MACAEARGGSLGCAAISMPTKEVAVRSCMPSAYSKSSGVSGEPVEKMTRSAERSLFSIGRTRARHAWKKRGDDPRCVILSFWTRSHGDESFG